MVGLPSFSQKYQINTYFITWLFFYCCRIKSLEGTYQLFSGPAKRRPSFCGTQRGRKLSRERGPCLLLRVSKFYKVRVAESYAPISHGPWNWRVLWELEMRSYFALRSFQNILRPFRHGVFLTWKKTNNPCVHSLPIGSFSIDGHSVK